MRSTASASPISAINPPPPNWDGTAEALSRNSAHAQLVLLVLAAVAVLMFKHMVADFYLQTPYQFLNKGTYGHPGGFMPCRHPRRADAARLSRARAGLACCSPLPSRSASSRVHYHIDWLKEQVTHRNGWTAHDRGFWYALGTDQLVHGLTYLG